MTCAPMQVMVSRTLLFRSVACRVRARFLVIMEMPHLWRRRADPRMPVRAQKGMAGFFCWILKAGTLGTGFLRDFVALSESS